MAAPPVWVRRAACGLWLCSVSLVLSVAAQPDMNGVIKYGLVFDAGSSGTRVHVYSWRVGGGGPKDSFDLIADDLLKIKPGLSAFKDDPSKAGASLRPLLAHAKTKVPAAEVSSTPVFLMATAGLRLVGEGPKDAILASVCDELSASGFYFRREWVSLLGGQDEGLYGWVTVNYLMEALYPPAVRPPVGIIDLGGGSVQIVYETPARLSSSAEAQTLSFGSRAHPLYVKSHLGYGLDEARKAVTAALLERRAGGAEDVISHPCLPKRASQTIDGVLYAGDGDWTRCTRLVGRLFRAGLTQGQPPLADRFFGFSYMYDRTAAIGLLDGVPRQFGSSEMTISAISAAGESICQLDADATTARFASTQDASKSHNYCGDVAYLTALLRAFGFGETAPITMTNKIKDVELVWTLGAMLAKSSQLAAAPSGGGLSLSAWLFLALAAVAAVGWWAVRASGERKYSQLSGAGLKGASHPVPAVPPPPSAAERPTGEC